MRAIPILVLALAMAAGAAAQDYPVRPVRIVVPFPAGGPNDLAVRPIAQKLQELLGQPFVLDFRPGANGIVGNEVVARAPADGYTLLVISTAFTINPSSYAKLPYDTVRDFTPVSPLAQSDIVFLVNPIVPARNVKEFVALARAHPGKLTFASTGAGGGPHLGGEMLKLAAKIDLVHVPYKGAAPALTDVIGGHVDSMFIGAAPAIPQVRAGKVRAIGVASPRRAASLPEVPTFEESGFKQFEVDSRYGLAAPAGTPAAVITRLNAEIAKAGATAEVKERYSASGLEAYSKSPQEYAKQLRDDIAKWRKVVVAAKLKPQ
ncbi:MAG: tripartite tricarboxylate transporter substrate binding protein [Betaproteobacteria bacterium]|nr:MAG: tripartite tricarboxylate transporter substrate binding protein [Betaproteobacteria bacterium]